MMLVSAVVFLIISAAAGAVTVLGFLGLIHVPTQVWWLPPFFTAIFGLTGLGHLWMGFSTIKRRRHAQELRETGLRGSARILQVQQTGVTINDNPQVECTLEITIPGMQVYSVTMKVVVPIIRVGLLTSPFPLTVFVNRADFNDVFIDW
jgi:hypothetical protein